MARKLPVIQIRTLPFTFGAEGEQKELTHYAVVFCPAMRALLTAFGQMD